MEITRSHLWQRMGYPIFFGFLILFIMTTHVGGEDPVAASTSSATQPDTTINSVGKGHTEAERTPHFPVTRSATFLIHSNELTQPEKLSPSTSITRKLNATHKEASTRKRGTPKSTARSLSEVQLAKGSSQQHDVQSSAERMTTKENEIYGDDLCNHSEKNHLQTSMAIVFSALLLLIFF